MSLPCVAGPYTTVSCSLRLMSSRVRFHTLGSGNANDQYGYTGVNDPRFRADSTTQTAISTSTGQNDNGMFDFNFRDERYLPFEGAGAVSTWQIDLTSDPKLRQFDYETITNVILHVKYTAREDVGPFKGWAQAHLANTIKMGLVAGNNLPLSRVFDARYEFPSEWYSFFHPAIAGADQELVLHLDKSRFPYFTQGWNFVIDGIHVYAKTTTGSGVSYVGVMQDADQSSTQNFTLNNANGYYAGPDAPVSYVGFDLGDAKLKLKRSTTNDYHSLPETDLDNLFVVVNYHLQ